MPRLPSKALQHTTLTVVAFAIVLAAATLFACNSGSADADVQEGGVDEAAASTVVSSVPNGDAGDAGPDATPRKPAPDPPPGAGFTCEVQTLLATKCQVCHTDPPQGGAQVPLLTVAQLIDWAVSDPNRSVASVAVDRIQSATSPMPPAFFNNPVTPAEAAAFKAWVDGNFVGSCAGSVPITATCTTCHGDTTRAGIAGADTNIKVAPPRSSKGETAVSARAVGAHIAHVNKTDFTSAPLACSACHVVPTSMAHSNGTVEMAFSGMAKSAGATPAWNGTTCTASYCHGNFPGGATTAAPSWTSGTPMACNSCHGAPPATPPHTNPAMECSTCHGAGYSATAKTVNKATHIDGVVTVNTTAANCNSCHGDAARVGIAGADAKVKSSPPLGSHGETAASTRAVGAHLAHVNKADFTSSPIACAECHVVPTSMAHSNGKVEMAFGAMATTGGAVPAWNGTTCANNYCHGAFPGGANAAPSWTDGPTNCTSCHGAPPSTAPHLANPAAECSTCHGAGYSQTAKTVNKPTHIDGAVQVSSSSQTCSSCHGDSARAGIAGADPQVKSAPPVGTKGETATSTRAVGAHVAHLNKGALSSPLSCSECHVVPISMSHSNAVVDMAFGSLAKTGGVAPTWNGTTCAGSYCHGNFPGGNTAAAPSWTSGTMACDSCHGAPPATPVHSNPATECSVCHGAGFSATAKTVDKTLHVNGIVDVNQSTLSCSSCHGDGARAATAGADPQLRASPPLGSKGETATSTRAVGAHMAHVSSAPISNPIACAECHVVPNSPSHSDGVVQMAFGTLSTTGGVNPAWNGTSCSASYCHGNFNGGNTAAAPSWTAGPMACDGCHGLPPSTPPHSNPTLGCTLCHGAGYSATGQTVNKLTHVNGVVDVDQTALTCVSCHGDSKRVPITGADTRQTAAPPLGTHGETATSARAVGAHTAHLNQATYRSAPIQCSECHSVPTSNLHSDGTAQVTFGTLAKNKGAAPVWNGTTCSKVYCHGSFTGGATLFAPSWTGGTVTCGSCHATPPTTGLHIDHHKGLPCSDCHAAGYSYTTTTKTVNKATHIDGTVEVQGTKITSYTASTKSCTPTCHGNERW